MTIRYRSDKPEPVGGDGKDEHIRQTGEYNIYKMHSSHCELCKGFGLYNEFCHHVCGSCGSYSKKIECSGIFHCNNLLCHGSGAAWFRYKLKSFEENLWDRTHTADAYEWEKEANKALKDNPGYVAKWPYRR